MKRRCGRKADEDLQPVDLLKQCFAGMDEKDAEYIPDNIFKYVNDKRSAERPEAYARKHWPPKWTSDKKFQDKGNITAGDIWLWISITLFMGLAKMPNLENYFRKTSLLSCHY